MQVPYIYVKTDDEILGALHEFARAPLIGTDTETTGLDPYTAELLLWQFSNGQSNVVIDCTVENAVLRRDTTSPVYRLLKDICSSKNCLKIGHNIGFDFKIIKKNLGFEMENLYDTMIAEKVLIAGKDVPSNRYQPLKVVVPKYTKFTERDMKKEIRAGFYSGYVLDGFTKDQLEYSARDVHVLHSIYWGQIYQLKEDDLDRVVQLEFDIIPAIAMMEYHGINMDLPYWRGLLAEAEGKMVGLRKEIQHYLKPLAKQKAIFDEFCEISMDSPTQLAVALRDLGLNVESTGKDILDKISGSHPILKPLLEYRNHAKFTSTYGEKLLAKINPVTGRIHGSFKQCSTSTGRMGAKNPNMTNIPKKQKFRRGFVSPENYSCVSADFSGQELRVLGYLCNEPNMLEAFKRNEDLHNRTTSLIYKKDLNELTALLDGLSRKKDEQRFNEITEEEEKWSSLRGICKSANFLTNYGGSFKRLAQTANISEEQAKEIINGLFRAYPNMKKYIAVEGNKAIDLGYSKTMMGRRRYYRLPPQNDPDYQKIAAAVKRQAVNHTIQGSSASMTKLAIKYAYHKFNEKFGGDNAYVAAAIHDELVAMAKDEHAEEAKQVLEDCMHEAFYTLIPRDACPSKVDCKSGKHWIH
jgi:DNA polymerase I